jgi:hypothetical protein
MMMTMDCRRAAQSQATAIHSNSQSAAQLTQAELPAQETRRKTRRVHRATGPQEEHVHLMVPRHVALVFGQLPRNGVALNAKPRIHLGLKPAHGAQEARLALHSGSADVGPTARGHALMVRDLLPCHSAWLVRVYEEGKKVAGTASKGPVTESAGKESDKNNEFA